MKGGKKQHMCKLDFAVMMLKVYMYTMLNLVCRQYRKHHFYFSHNVELMEKSIMKHLRAVKNNYYGYFWMCLMRISGPAMILHYDEITIKYNLKNTIRPSLHIRHVATNTEEELERPNSPLTVCNNVMQPVAF